MKWTVENVQILQNGFQGEQPLFMEVCICVSTEHECEVQHLNRARVKSCRFRRIARGSVHKTGACVCVCAQDGCKRAPPDFAFNEARGGR